MQSMEVNKKHCQGKKAEDFIWVQCDNPKCMKWRKLPKVVCNDLSSVTWFCHMNADEAHNSCDVKEEKMHVPRGRTVVFSELEVGSLVWAKFSGYPRWPGVISPDPCFGDRIHIIRYNDGTNDPKYYHIEFLGKPHTHAWVSARYVQIYSVSIGETEFTQNAMKRKAMKLSFQKSISEASQMLELTQDQRLEKCIYRCIKMADDISEQTCFKAQRRMHGKKSHGRLKNEILSTGDLREMCANKLFVNVNGVMYPVQMDQKQQAMSVDWPNRNDVVSPITQDTGMALEKQLSCKNGVGEKPVIKKKMKRRGRKGHGQMLQERKGYLNQVNDLTKSSPEKKNGMSKSEKTRIDVEINRNCAIIQNESTFMKLFNTFCLSKKNPTETVHISWYKKSVNLFEFFKKVQYMGGYKQAISHAQIWKGVCQDVLKVNLDSQFTSLKKAYKQVLLPFEKHIKKRLKNANLLPTVCQKGKENLESKQSTSAFSSTISFSPVYAPPPSIKTSQCPVILPPPSSVQYITATNKGVLKNVFPSMAVTMAPEIGDLPSSNPESPFFLRSPVPTSISDIGLDVTMGELDNLEKLIFDMTNQPNDASCDSESRHVSDDASNDCYAPVLGDEKVEDLNDVLGELTDLEDTLVEMASDILGGDHRKHF